MKKLIFATATAMLCFLISCNESGSSTNDNSQKNLDNNRKVMKAIETGDSATINGLIADDAVDHQGMNGQDVKGGDNVRHMLADIHNHVKDMKFDIIADAANGDYIFTLSTMKGTSSDSSFGMKPGMSMSMTGVDVVKVNKDGKMTEHWGFVDANEMMKQMQAMQGDHKMDNMNGKMDSTKMKK